MTKPRHFHPAARAACTAALLGLAFITGAGGAPLRFAVMVDTNAALVYPSGFALSNGLATAAALASTSAADRAAAVDALALTSTADRAYTLGQIASTAETLRVETTNLVQDSTNDLGTAARKDAGAAIGDLPQWAASPTGAEPGAFICYDDDAAGGLTVMSAINLIGGGWLGSACTNQTDDFARPSLTNGLGGRTLLARAGNAWPRTFIATGFNYYDYGAGITPGGLCSIAFGYSTFPQGLYTNVARLAVHIRWTKNAACGHLYATNFTLRITGAGPLGPAGGAWVLWNQACDWQPTNSGTWAFADLGGGICTASTTGTILNARAPIYNTYSAVHVPLIYLINGGTSTVDHATCAYAIEYNNGTAD